MSIRRAEKPEQQCRILQTPARRVKLQTPPPAPPHCKQSDQSSTPQQGAKEKLVTLISKFEASIVSFHCGVNFLMLVCLFTSYLGEIPVLAGEGKRKANTRCLTGISQGFPAPWLILALGVCPRDLQPMTISRMKLQVCHP